MPTASVVASQRQPDEIDPRRGTTVLGRADSGKRAQPICTQSDVAPLRSEVIAKAASHGRISGPRR